MFIPGLGVGFMKRKAVVVLSGGMDSTTLLYKMKDEGFECYAISFDYGQKHNKELQMAEATCKKLKVNYRVVDLRVLQSLLPSALTDEHREIPEGHYADEVMKQTVVPNRNAILLSIAVGYAKGKGISTIGVGVHAGDHPIYPDCRPEFVKSFEDMTRNAVGEKDFTILSPFINWSKGDIVALGIMLHVDYNLTWSCYKGDALACGKCGTCIERLEAFKESGNIDPIGYVDSAEMASGVKE